LGEPLPYLRSTRSLTGANSLYNSTTFIASQPCGPFAAPAKGLKHGIPVHARLHGPDLSQKNIF
jgi:hypothetical protein